MDSKETFKKSLFTNKFTLGKRKMNSRFDDVDHNQKGFIGQPPKLDFEASRATLKFNLYSDKNNSTIRNSKFLSHEKSNHNTQSAFSKTDNSKKRFPTTIAKKNKFFQMSPEKINHFQPSAKKNLKNKKNEYNIYDVFNDKCFKFTSFISLFIIMIGIFYLISISYKNKIVIDSVKINDDLEDPVINVFDRDSSIDDIQVLEEKYDSENLSKIKKKKTFYDEFYSTNSPIHNPLKQLQNLEVYFNNKDFSNDFLFIDCWGNIIDPKELKSLYLHFLKKKIESNKSEKLNENLDENQTEKEFEEIPSSSEFYQKIADKNPFEFLNISLASICKEINKRRINAGLTPFDDDDENQFVEIDNFTYDNKDNQEMPKENFYIEIESASEENEIDLNKQNLDDMKNNFDTYSTNSNSNYTEDTNNDIKETNLNNKSQDVEQNQSQNTEKNQSQDAEKYQSQDVEQNQSQNTEKNQSQNTKQNQSQDVEQNQLKDVEQHQSQDTEQNEKIELQSQKEFEITDNEDQENLSSSNKKSNKNIYHESSNQIQTDLNDSNQEIQNDLDDDQKVENNKSSSNLDEIKNENEKNKSRSFLQKIIDDFNLLKLFFLKLFTKSELKDSNKTNEYKDQIEKNVHLDEDEKSIKNNNNDNENLINENIFTNNDNEGDNDNETNNENEVSNNFQENNNDITNDIELNEQHDENIKNQNEDKKSLSFFQKLIFDFNLFKISFTNFFHNIFTSFNFGFSYVFLSLKNFLEYLYMSIRSFFIKLFNFTWSSKPTPSSNENPEKNYISEIDQTNNLNEEKEKNLSTNTNLEDNINQEQDIIYNDIQESNNNENEELNLNENVKNLNNEISSDEENENVKNPNDEIIYDEQNENDEIISDEQNENMFDQTNFKELSFLSKLKDFTSNTKHNIYNYSYLCKNFILNTILFSSWNWIFNNILLRIWNWLNSFYSSIKFSFNYLINYSKSGHTKSVNFGGYQRFNKPIKSADETHNKNDSPNNSTVEYTEEVISHTPDAEDYDDEVSNKESKSSSDNVKPTPQQVIPDHKNEFEPTTEEYLNSGLKFSINEMEEIVEVPLFSDLKQNLEKFDPENKIWNWIENENENKRVVISEDLEDSENYILQTDNKDMANNDQILGLSERLNKIELDENFDLPESEELLKILNHTLYLEGYDEDIDKFYDDHDLFDIEEFVKLAKDLDDSNLSPIQKEIKKYLKKFDQLKDIKQDIIDNNSIIIPKKKELLNLLQELKNIDDNSFNQQLDLNNAEDDFKKAKEDLSKASDALISLENQYQNEIGPEIKNNKEKINQLENEEKELKNEIDNLKNKMNKNDDTDFENIDLDQLKNDLKDLEDSESELKFQSKIDNEKNQEIEEQLSKYSRLLELLKLKLAKLKEYLQIYQLAQQIKHQNMENSQNLENFKSTSEKRLNKIRNLFKKIHNVNENENELITFDEQLLFEVMEDSKGQEQQIQILLDQLIESVQKILEKSGNFQLKEYEDKIKKLKHVISVLEKKYYDTNTTYQQNNDLLNNKNRELQSISNKRESHQNHINNIEEKLLSQKKNFNLISRQIDALNQQHSDTIERKNNLLNENQYTISDIKGKFNMLKNSKLEASQKLINARKNKNQIQNQYTNLQNKKIDLNNEKLNLFKDIEDLEETKNSLKDQFKTKNYVAKQMRRGIKRALRFIFFKQDN